MNDGDLCVRVEGEVGNKGLKSSRQRMGKKGKALGGGGGVNLTLIAIATAAEVYELTKRKPFRHELFLSKTHRVRGIKSFRDSVFFFPTLRKWRSGTSKQGGGKSWTESLSFCLAEWLICARSSGAVSANQGGILALFGGRSPQGTTNARRWPLF